MHRSPIPVPNHRKRWLANANDMNDEDSKATTEAVTDAIGPRALWIRATNHKDDIVQDLPLDTKDTWVSTAPPRGYFDTHGLAILREKHGTEARTGQNTLLRALQRSSVSLAPSTDFTDTDVAILEHVLGHSINSEKAYWRVRKGQGIQNLHAEMRKREEEIWGLMRQNGPWLYNCGSAGWGDNQKKMKQDVRTILGFDKMETAMNVDGIDTYGKSGAEETKATEIRRSEVNKVAMQKMKEIMAERKIARDRIAVEEQEELQKKKAQARADKVLHAQNKTEEIMTEQRKSATEKVYEVQAARERENEIAQKIAEERKEVEEYVKRLLAERREKARMEGRKKAGENTGVGQARRELKYLRKAQIDGEMDEEKRVEGMVRRKVHFKAESRGNAKKNEEKQTTQNNLEEHLNGKAAEKLGIMAADAKDKEGKTNATKHLETDTEDTQQADDDIKANWTVVEDEDKNEWEIVNSLDVCQHIS